MYAVRQQCNGAECKGCLNRYDYCNRLLYIHEADGYESTHSIHSVQRFCLRDDIYMLRSKQCVFKQ